MNLELSNAQFDALEDTLEKYLDRTDKLGYVAARNYHVIGEKLYPFMVLRDNVIRKYGVKSDKSDSVHDEYKITKDSEHYDDALKEITDAGAIKIDVDIMTIDASELEGKLSGRQLVELAWMLEGFGENASSN